MAEVPADGAVVDLIGLSSEQRQHVRVVAEAVAAGLLPDLAELQALGTPVEVYEEAAWRLRGAAEIRGRRGRYFDTDKAFLKFVQGDLAGPA